MACGLLFLAITRWPRHVVWNFVLPTDASQWTGVNLRITQDPRRGLAITSDANGALHSPLLSLPMDRYPTIQLDLQSQDGTRGVLTVRTAAMRESDTPLGVPFEAPPGDQSLVFSLGESPLWTGELTEIRITTPEPEQFSVGSVVVRHRSPLAELATLARSYGTFNRFRRYVINVTLGPHITIDPAWIPHLFDEGDVYTTWSANILTYLALILVALLTAIIAWLRQRPLLSAVLVSLFAAIGVSWVVSDVRMGSEMISYVAEDVRTYLRRTPPSRSFREFGAIYDFADFAAARLPPGEPYNLIAPNPWPYVGILRYATTPALPLFIDQPSQAQHPLWVFYETANVSFRQGRLYVGDQPITRTGSLLGTFAEGSFLFVEGTPPTSS